jgi:hypothetical protein
MFAIALIDVDLMLNEKYILVKQFVKQFMKKKMGRPKLPKGETKDILIGARVAPEENKAILAAIAKSPHSKSEWIRKALISAAKTDKPFS